MEGSRIVLLREHKPHLMRLSLHKSGDLADVAGVRLGQIFDCEVDNQRMFGHVYAATAMEVRELSFTAHYGCVAQLAVIAVEGVGLGAGAHVVAVPVLVVIFVNETIGARSSVHAHLLVILIPAMVRALAFLCAPVGVHELAAVAFRLHRRGRARVAAPVALCTAFEPVEVGAFLANAILALDSPVLAHARDACEAIEDGTLGALAHKGHGICRSIDARWRRRIRGRRSARLRNRVVHAGVRALAPHLPIIHVSGECAGTLSPALIEVEESVVWAYALAIVIEGASPARVGHTFLAVGDLRRFALGLGWIYIRLGVER